jgi:hypothetical protein
MSKSENGPLAMEVDPISAEAGSGYGSGLPAVDGERYGEPVSEDGADLGGHTLLSRSPAPQGRRSLFRR